jgi:hypothetical protein
VRHRTSIWRQESIHLCEGGTAREEVPQIRRGILPQGRQRQRRSSPAACLMGISPPASHGEVAHPGATAVAPAGSPPDLLHSRRSSPLLCSLPDGAHHQPRAAALMGEVTHLCATGRGRRACPPPRPSRLPRAVAGSSAMAAWSLCRILFSCGRADPGEDKNEQGKTESREAQCVYKIEKLTLAILH